MSLSAPGAARRHEAAARRSALPARVDTPRGPPPRRTLRPPNLTYPCEKSKHRRHINRTRGHSPRKLISTIATLRLQASNSLTRTAEAAAALPPPPAAAPHHVHTPKPPTLRTHSCPTSIPILRPPISHSTPTLHTNIQSAILHRSSHRCKQQKRARRASDRRRARQATH